MAGNSMQVDWRGLIALAGRRKPGFLAACGLTMASVVLALAPFLLAALLARDAVSEGPTGAGLALALAVCLIAHPLVVALASVLAHFSAFDVLFLLRRDLVAKMTRLPQAVFLKRPASALKRVLFEEVETLELFLSHQMPDVLACVAVPLVTVAILAVVSWPLALACLAVVPLIMVAQRWMMRGHAARMGEYFGRIGAFGTGAADYVRGLETIRGMAGGALLVEDLKGQASGFRDFAETWFGQWGPGWSVYSTVAIAAPAVVLPVGLLLHGAGVTPLEDLIFGLFVATGLGGPLVKMTIYGEITLRVAQAHRKIRQLMDEPELPTLPPAPPPVDGTLCFDSVSLAVDGRAVLRDVSFTVPSGSLTAVIGLSGAGKTTLLRLASNALSPDRGRVSLGGCDLRSLPPEMLARHIGVVAQGTFLFDDTLAANIAVGRRDATAADVEAAAVAAGCHDFIRAFPDGYDTRAGEGGRRLSGGQRQRIALARALLAEAPVLLLDEATAFVDPWQEARLQQAVNKLVGRRSVVVVSHRLNSVIDADQIIFLHQGRVAAKGDHAALLATCPDYAALWQVQCANLDWNLRAEGPEPVQEGVVS